MSENGHGRVHILQLKARNVKLLKEVAIDFKGDIHEIAGDTGQGKTSILESIEGAIRGLDPRMVRKGQTKAEIELVLDEATIKRILGEDGKEVLMVTDARGKTVERAKEFLKTLCGPTAFRPVEWVQLGGGDGKGRTERLRRQRDMLLEALSLTLTQEIVMEAVDSLGDEFTAALAEVNLDGVDFEQHPFVVCSALERVCYDYRKLQNSKAEEAENRLKVTPAPERSAPKRPIEELAAEEQKAIEAYHQAKGRTSSRAALQQQRTALAATIEEERAALPERERVQKTLAKLRRDKELAESEIETLKRQLEEKQQYLRTTEEQIERGTAVERRWALQDGRIQDLAAMDQELARAAGGEDLAALEKAMERARADAEARRLQDAHDAAAHTAAQARERAETFSRLVVLFRDDLPKALLETANLPVKGLGVDGDCVIINGVPLHQLGTSEQIRVGCLIASALNPRSGFVLVDGAESLGRKDRAALAEAAHELGLQLIMSVVDPDATPAEGRTVMAAGEVVG